MYRPIGSSGPPTSMPTGRSNLDFGPLIPGFDVRVAISPPNLHEQTSPPAPMARTWRPRRYFLRRTEATMKRVVSIRGRRTSRSRDVTDLRGLTRVAIGWNIKYLPRQVDLLHREGCRMKFLNCLFLVSGMHSESFSTPQRRGLSYEMLLTSLGSHFGLFSM